MAENMTKVSESAVLRYAKTPPSAAELDAITGMLCNRLNVSDITIETVLDESLGGGFILQYGNYEYDWSDAGRTKQLENFLRDEKNRDTGKGALASVKSRLEDFHLEIEDREVGQVRWLGNGIAQVDGIRHAFYGEIVEFDDGTRGMVQDVRRDHIGCILFGDETGISQDSKVFRTYRPAGLPVGENFIGRAVNALGEPLDGKGRIIESDYRPLETPAPGIIVRESVNQPLETGILSIDTMFPIGRGQRELIIGDRQTGKTSIAMDTIINQKGKDVICIYVAIGQKASTIAQMQRSLEKAGAGEYTIMIVSTAADAAPLQYLAPYAGCAMAEYFMHKGKDALIVYDDLSKHAVAYRTISLLLERPPGREAYPGDVFYLHSRLLERSSKLAPAYGGGSITALPIIETQAGDVASYIPTNVISITDGQIYLESDLFNSGMRPAVNVGLSVSRVGSAAQTKAMKKAAGSIRVDLAQYREMAVFTQFSSDLDEATSRQLAHGAALMELLKQPLGAPLSMSSQVITLIAAGEGVFDKLPVPEVNPFRYALLDHFKNEHADIITRLDEGKDLPDDLRAEIVKVIDRFCEK